MFLVLISYLGVAAAAWYPRPTRRAGVPVETGRFSLFASSTSSVSSRCAAEVSPGAGSSGGSMPGGLVGDHRRPPATGPRQRRGRRRLLANNEAESGGAGGAGRGRAARRTNTKDDSVFRGEVSLSRASVLKGTSGVMAGLLLAGVGGGLGGIVGAPAAARAEQGQQQQQDKEGALEEYASPDGSFALRYPVGFKGFSKPLKTHKVEVSFQKQRRLVESTGCAGPTKQHCCHNRPCSAVRPPLCTLPPTLPGVGASIAVGKVFP